MKSSEDQKTQSQDTAKPASPSRRRLLRAGTIGAPALLALKSTPVMACNCLLPSGFSTSGNLSANKGKTCADYGTRPKSWTCDYKGNYTGTTCRPEHQVSTYLKCDGSPYSSMRLDACLAQGNLHPQAMAMACYLQGLQGSSGTLFPSANEIAKMWSMGVCSSAGYQPSWSSTVWHQNECYAYLRYLTGQTV